MRRALVARLDSAGDVLLAGPAVRAVAADPGIDEVVLLCSAQGAPAGRLLPGVDRVLVWDSPWIVDPAPPATREHIAALDALLDGAMPDVAVLLTSFHQSPLPLALLLRLAGVPFIAGASVDYAGSLLDVRLKPGETLDEDRPEPERALAIARAAGFELPAGDDGRLRVALRESFPANADANPDTDTDTDTDPDVLDLIGPDAHSDPFVVVHPGAAVPARAWPTAHSRELVRLLTERGIRVVVTGGPGERETTAEVAGRAGIDLGGRTDMPVLARLLARAAVVVTGNTGPAHLAAAVGTPIVSLFSPVVPAVRWAPYGVPVELLGDQDAACRGSRARVCPVPGHPCLAGVPPEQVLAAVERLATQTGRPLAAARTGGPVDRTPAAAPGSTPPTSREVPA